MNNKQTLRQQALARRRSLSDENKQAASHSIRLRLVDELARNGQFAAAPLLLYRALGDEVDTAPLFEAGSGVPMRDIFAPVTHQAGHMLWRRVNADTRWQRGDFGVFEPATGALWDPLRETSCPPAVLVCPLVGFDSSGNRLGMGKGCFDRWLGGVKDHILLRIGLAFACQQCPEIPAEPHDIPLHMIITEGETIACRSS